MENKLNVSSNPHNRSSLTTSLVMLLVIIALLPATGFGIVNFGVNAILLVVISIASSILFEFLFNLICKRKNSIGDLSAVVTGLLLALNLPPTAPWWIPIVGSFFAIIVAKMLFGGLGQNFVNPALAGRCFLLISFTSIMTNFNIDSYSGATPLAMLKAGETVDLSALIKGYTAGTIGETSAIALLIGAIFLMITGIIDLVIPGIYIASFALFVGLFAPQGFNAEFIASEIAGGGLILGAFFMATDYVTRPITKQGQAIYGLFLGFMTAVLRVFGPSAEGVSYAILIGNLLVPLIDKVTKPRYFGKGGTKA